MATLSIFTDKKTESEQVEVMDIKGVKIGIVGGTGEEGRGLGLRFAKAGARVVIGSRTVEKAREAAEEVNRLSGIDAAGAVGYASNPEAVTDADFVLLTVPFAHAAATLAAVAENLRPGAIVVDITVPVSFEQSRVRYVEMPEGSGSEHLQAILPATIPLIAAFKTEPAHLLADAGAALDCDTFVAGDDKEAKARVIELIRHIEGLRPVDAGTLYSARCLERMTVMLIGINRRNKSRTGRFRVLGV